MPNTLEAPPAAAPAAPAAPPPSRSVAPAAAAPAAKVRADDPAASPNRKPPIKERSLFKSLERLSGKVNDPADLARKPAAEDAGADDPSAKPADAPEGAAKSADAPKPGDVQPDAKPDAKAAAGKFNPIKELKAARTRLSELESENTRLKASIVPEQERANLTQRMDTIQRENEELKNKLRFKDYESHPDFVNTYHKPYQEALGRAMDDLQRIPITDANGAQRAANEQDLFELVNLMHTNLPEAKRRATEVFGELAPEVMSMANDVRKTLAARNAALENEKKNGATREQQQLDAARRAQETAINNFVKAYSDAAQAQINNPKDPEFAALLKPIPVEAGKTATPEELEHNAALEKGFKLFDEWIGRHPGTAKTPEERAEIIRRHTAIRARTAAFGPLRRQFRRLSKRLAEAESKLASYQQTAPDLSGRQPNGGKPVETPFRSSFKTNLERRSR